ncbi:hypothetical protein STEG23_038190 [Scotinomys teguina]
MEVVAAAPRCQLLLIMLMAVMLLPGMKGSPLLIQRTVTRNFELQESIIGKGQFREVWHVHAATYLWKSVDTLLRVDYFLLPCGPWDLAQYCDVPMKYNDVTVQYCDVTLLYYDVKIQCSDVIMQNFDTTMKYCDVNQLRYHSAVL